MNLKSIAQELGISPSTVSRVVNGNKNFSVSPELREKILARANATGYTPNPMYQAMRKKDNRHVMRQVDDVGIRTVHFRCPPICSFRTLPVAPFSRFMPLRMAFAPIRFLMLRTAC